MPSRLLPAGGSRGILAKVKHRGILLSILALALVQVPWIPCHCGETCEIRPLLVTMGHHCDDPDHEVIHRTCPAHGCTGHRVEPPPCPPAPEPAPEPAPDSDHDHDHDHDVFLLQAVSSPPVPSLPLGTSLAWLEAVDAGVTAPRVPTDGEHVGSGGGTGPPPALATVRLLV